MKKQSVKFVSAAFAVGLGLALAAPLPTAAQQDPHAVGGAKRCTAYWKAHKKELQASGKTKKDFMGPCMNGTWIFM
jgi:hypothetical protein